VATPEEFGKVFGKEEAESLLRACRKKARKLEIEAEGKYTPDSF